MRGDQRGYRATRRAACFDPRPCVRGDFTALLILRYGEEFRSTPLREGRQREEDGLLLSSEVSIHAPA